MAKLTNGQYVDEVKVFLHYLSFVGDVEKTALASDIDPSVVRELATGGGWNDKLRRLTLSSKESGLPSGDYERLCNRALAWCQGHRVRLILDRVILGFEAQSNEDLVEGITERDKLGNTRVNARVFSDLAKAVETANHLCFSALGDSVTERKALSPDAAQSTASVHAALIAALNNPHVKAISSEQLVIDASKAIDALPATAEPPALPAPPQAAD